MSETRRQALRQLKNESNCFGPRSYPLSSPVTNTYKFQQLRVYKLALEYVDTVYELSEKLPESERFNLRSQLERAATSIALNIAEGSTGQSDAEQKRFLGPSPASCPPSSVCHQEVESITRYVSPECPTNERCIWNSSNLVPRSFRFQPKTQNSTPLFP